MTIQEIPYGGIKTIAQRAGVNRDTVKNAIQGGYLHHGVFRKKTYHNIIPFIVAYLKELEEIENQLQST